MNNEYVYYNGTKLSAKEALKLLLNDGTLKKAPKNYVKLYTYIFNEEKHLIKKDICNLEANDDGSIGYKYKVDLGVDDIRTYTTRVRPFRMSTPTDIKPNRFSGAYRVSYVTYTEETDYPYLGGTHMERHYHDENDYVDGRCLGVRSFCAKDNKCSKEVECYYTCNGVKGPRYEFYSLEPLSDECFEKWQSDQNWFKIKKFDELYGGK